jgi:hypothetical protein
MHQTSTISTQLSVACALFLLTFAASVANAGPSVTIGLSTPFADSSGVSEKVRGECTLDTRLPRFIQDYARKMGIEVNLGSDTKGRVLALEFTTIVGPGGGAWSGAKSVTVKGTLTENGKVIGTFIGSRYSGGGIFAMYKGTCSILGRCIKTLGKDIANGLSNPTMDARLGNA